jgi:hypothetical protein
VVEKPMVVIRKAVIPQNSLFIDIFPLLLTFWAELPVAQKVPQN